MPSGLVDISLVGDKALQRKLKSLDFALQKKILRKALRAGAKPVRDAARTNAPVREGKIKKSIKVRAMKRSRKGIGVLVAVGTRQELGISEEDFYNYAVGTELGTSKAAAQPYLRPALDSKSSEALKIIAREIDAGIKSEARKGVRT